MIWNKVSHTPIHPISWRALPLLYSSMFPYTIFLSFALSLSLSHTHHTLLLLFLFLLHHIFTLSSSVSSPLFLSLSLSLMFLLLLFPPLSLSLSLSLSFVPPTLPPSFPILYLTSLSPHHTTLVLTTFWNHPRNLKTGCGRGRMCKKMSIIRS